MKQKFLIKVVSSGEILATVELDKKDNGYVCVGGKYHKVENHNFGREIDITQLVYWELTDDGRVKTHWNVRRQLLKADEYYCGYCGRFHKVATPFCPNCGAKMDGIER